jgi:hypothetical protein
VRSDIVAGGRLRDRFGSREPAPVFAVLGVALVAGGLTVSAFETLLFVWGGTALFVALLLRFVMTGPTVSSTVATDIYTTMAGNTRRAAPSGRHRYVPDADGVGLVVGDREFEAVGDRLLASGVDLPPGSPDDDALSVLADAIVNDFELASRVRATTDGDVATVTVTESRVGTTELFDHPVASVIGVGLARASGVPVAVETAVENGTLVVTAEPISFQ